MGIFAKLKEIFNKNIECGELILDHMVYFLKKKKYIYLGKNIIVRDGSACVVVFKNKVCDVILPGKYKINEEVIPETYSRAKIEKLAKKHKKIKKLRVQIYYINTQELAQFDFQSKIPFLVKSPELGKIKGFLEGSCMVRVIDPAILVKNLLHSLRKVRTDTADKKIGLWVGNKINQKVQKLKIPMNTILLSQDSVEAKLNIGLEDSYDNYGLYVKNIKLKAVNFPKKYLSKINEYMAKRNKVIISKNETQSRQSVTLSVNANTQAKQLNSGLNNAMQDVQKTININTFKVCPKCGFKNYITKSKCNNCNNKM